MEAGGNLQQVRPDPLLNKRAKRQVRDLAPGHRAESAASSCVSEQLSSSVPSLEMAYVVFMDIVGYSLFQTDYQPRLLAQLREAIQASATFREAQARDELITLPVGDGVVLVFFRDPIAPVRCALEISRALSQFSVLKLRIGIHTGPVYRVADINANRNVAGGGINMAQRTMECGDAGHILLSRSMAEVLREFQEWAPHLQDLGEHEVKHGVRLHLFNFCTPEAGNPAITEKLISTHVDPRAIILRESAPDAPAKRKWRRRAFVATGSFAASLVIGAALWFGTRMSPSPALPPPSTGACLPLFHHRAEVSRPEAVGRSIPFFRRNDLWGRGQNSVCRKQSGLRASLFAQ